MARTTALAVQSILQRDYDHVNQPSLTSYIDTASAIVDRVKTCAAARSRTLTLAELELIERWLAAHCYVLSDQTYASKNTEGASASFHGQTAMHLESSRYGQMAIDVDYSGCLEAISKRLFAGGFWLGRPPSDQTDYVNRD